MLKLNASYSKKVPAAEEYSSKSYHASVEVELPDGLTGEQLSGRIHETFDLVRQSVESELAMDRAERTPYEGVELDQRQEEPQAHPVTRKFQNGNNGGNGSSRKQDEGKSASNKQIKYLLDLTRERNIDPATLLRKVNVNSVYDLTSTQCSSLIDGITGNTKRKAA